MKQDSLAGDEARIGKNRNDCKVFVGKPEELKELGPTRRQVINIKLNLKEIRWVGV